MHKKQGMLLPVGGHIELDETPWQAAAHELEEEAGYTLSELSILQPKIRIKNLSRALLHPQPVVMNTHLIANDHWHSATEYAFVTDHAPSGRVANNESSDLRWISQEDLALLNDDDIYPNTREVYNYILNELLSAWIPVPTSDFGLVKALE
jgi:8-oxo-dGTP pyrophosphatase MutT (NUDIX family)